jgi:hypothetical protein
MTLVTVNERSPACPLGEGDGGIRSLLAAEAAARGGAEVALAWGAPAPWGGAGQERLVGRAPGVEVVWVRGASEGTTAVRVRRTEEPTFELTWKRGGELVVSATVPDRHVEALRAALSALAVPAPPPAPLRARTRAELLGAVAAAATAVGDELSALDHGAGSWDRIGMRDRELRSLLDELPADDEAALRAHVEAGVVARWAEVVHAARERGLTKADVALSRERAQALQIAALGGRAGAPGAWASAAARLRDALEAGPPRRAAALAEEWARVAQFHAAAGDLGGARDAFERALAASATIARRALLAPPLAGWRADLADLAHRGKLPKAAARHEGALARTWVPAVRLAAVSGPTADGPSSRLGGLPSLPEATPWPEGPDGAPASFLLQLDLASLPALPPLPPRGLLLFFLADAPGHGYATREAGVRVLHVADPPPTARAAPASARVLVPRPCALSGSPAVEPASPPDAALARLCPALAGDAPAVRALGRAFPTAGTKLGGYAFFNQEDPRAADTARADHALLLQIAEEPAAGLAWGDAGVGHVFVPPADLARLDFSRAWWAWDSL